jgi:hypothetical protein
MSRSEEIFQNYKKRLESSAKRYEQTKEPPSYQEPAEPESEVDAEQKPDLVRQYEVTQERAQHEVDLEQQAIEATNPHTMFKDIVTKPTKRGIYPLTIMGRPIDLSKLENYMVFKVSPRTTTTLLRYNDVKAIEEAQNYGRRNLVGGGKKKSRFMIWILIIAVIIIAIVGILFLTQGDKITAFFSGLMGGMGANTQPPPG